LVAALQGERKKASICCAGERETLRLGDVMLAQSAAQEASTLGVG
jgi:hypothetical protein